MSSPSLEHRARTNLLGMTTWMPTFDQHMGRRRLGSTNLDSSMPILSHVPVLLLQHCLGVIIPSLGICQLSCSKQLLSPLNKAHRPLLHYTVACVKCANMGAAFFGTHGSITHIQSWHSMPGMQSLVACNESRKAGGKGAYDFDDRQIGSQTQKTAPSLPAGPNCLTLGMTRFSKVFQQMSKEMQEIEAAREHVSMLESTKLPSGTQAAIMQQAGE